MNTYYTQNFAGAGAFWLVLVIAGCGSEPERVSPTALRAAHAACTQFGGLGVFKEKELSTGIYVQAQCRDPDDTRIRTRIGHNREEVLAKDREILFKAMQETLQQGVQQ